MLPLIGFIISAYTVARLVQVPLEFRRRPDSPCPYATAWVTGVSVVAIAAICLFTALLYGAGVQAELSGRN